MSSIVQRGTGLSSDIIEKVVVGGDLSRLNSQERLSYYSNVCESVGLNPLTRPFEYIQLNGKLTLYARRDATDQLRNVHKVSINITSREMIGDVFIVTARARNVDGREDESTGAVFAGGLKGEALANAMMKAETKAKRRVTLSLCGLGVLDETEVETIESATTVDQPKKTALPKPTPKPQDIDPGEYVATFGKYKGQALKDLDIFELANYAAFIEQKAIDDNKPIRGQVAEFMSATSAFLNANEAREHVVEGETV